MSGETSFSRHSLNHEYAAPGDHFPGSSLGHGGTAQSVGRPEILGEAEVGQPSVRRVDKKDSSSQPRRRKPRR